MKKIKCMIFVLIMLIVNSKVVLAKSTNNGIIITNENLEYTNLKCIYDNDMYINIQDKAILKAESNTTDLTIVGEGYEKLKENLFVDEYNNFDCPLYIEVEENKIINFYNTESKDGLISLKIEDSYCEGICKIETKEENTQTLTEETNESTKNMEVSKICKEPTILKAFQITGKILYIVKIIIPVVLMIMGVFDFAKAVISTKNGLGNAAKTFFIRVIAGIAIFFLPTLVSFTLGLLPQSELDFRECNVCLIHPNECHIPKETDN